MPLPEGLKSDEAYIGMCTSLGRRSRHDAHRQYTGRLNPSYQKLMESWGHVRSIMGYFAQQDKLNCRTSYIELLEDCRDAT